MTESNDTAADTAAPKGAPDQVRFFWRTYTGYTHKQDGNPFMDLTQSLPEVLVLPLDPWKKAWAVGVLHTDATSQEEVDRMIDDAIEELGPRILDPGEQARYYIGEDIADDADEEGADEQDPAVAEAEASHRSRMRPGFGQPEAPTAPTSTSRSPFTFTATERAAAERIYYPFRPALAAGYEVFAKQGTRENIARYRYATFDEYIRGVAEPPTDEVQPLPRRQQRGNAIPLSEALATLPTKPAERLHVSLFRAIMTDPLSTATDLLVQHDYAIPSQAGIPPEETEPGDVITWSDGTFGLVLADELVYSADRGLILLEKAVAAPDFIGAWNISTGWRRPKVGGIITNPALLKKMTEATAKLTAANKRTADAWEEIARKLDAATPDEIKQSRKKAGAFADAAKARRAATADPSKPARRSGSARA